MTELTYTKNGDYRIPDLKLSEEPESKPLQRRAQPNGNRSINQGFGESFPNKHREISGIRKSPCSSSLYKRRHCLPSVPSRMRFFFRINAYGCTSRKPKWPHEI